MLKNNFSCFDRLSMNGKSPMFSTHAPFALSLLKGKRGVFQHPVRVKGSGKPDDRKGHVRFDAAGAGDGFMAMLVRHCQTKGAETDRHFLQIPRQFSTLPEV
jgi:hypothetical protein